MGNKKLFERKKINGKVYFLTWFKGYKKSDAEWIKRSELIKTANKLVTEFEQAK